MSTGRRHHFDWNETKKSIIEFMLNIDYPVNEPAVSDFLRGKYGEFERSTINKHLLQLVKLGCFESSKTANAGKFVFYDIKTLKNLKNIRTEFPDIRLNGYEKPLNILLRENGYQKPSENGYYMTSFGGFHFYILLLISASFFDACVETDIETLYKRALGIHMYKNSHETISIETQLNESYTTYTKRYPNLELSPKSFASIMEEMVQKKDEISSTEMFMKVWEKELLGLPKDKSNAMHQETMEDDLKIYWGMRRTTFWIWERDLELKLELFDLLFEHYFFQDLLNDNASDEEIHFAMKTKANDEECNEMSKDWKRNNDWESNNNIAEYHAFFDKRVLNDLEQASIVIASYRLPSFFDKETYKDSEAISQKLKEYYNTHKK